MCSPFPQNFFSPNWIFSQWLRRQNIISSKKLQQSTIDKMNPFTNGMCSVYLPADAMHWKMMAENVQCKMHFPIPHHNEINNSLWLFRTHSDCSAFKTMITNKSRCRLIQNFFHFIVWKLRSTNDLCDEKMSVYLLVHQPQSRAHTRTILSLQFFFIPFNLKA